MVKDNLYKKSIIAIFFLIAFGISIFFYGNNLEKKHNEEAARLEKEKNNLANLISQNKNEALEGFQNLSEEAKQVEKNNMGPETGSSKELENLLKNL